MKYLNMLWAGTFFLMSVNAYGGSAPLLRDKTRRTTALPGCVLTQTVSLTINFNSPVGSPSKAKETFDLMLQTVKDAAAQEKIDNLAVQSMNYTVSPQQYGMTVTNYMLSGNVGFTLKDVDKASHIMEKLNTKGMTSSMSVSAYQNGNCSQPSAVE